MEKNAPLGIKPDAARQNLAFRVLTDQLQFLWRIRVGDAHGFLFDNRAFVQIGCGEMCGGPDDFDTALIGLMVRFGALKTRQERMVDVDDMSCVFFSDIIG